MMNYIWAVMLVLGVVFAVINVRLNEFSEGLMKSCTDGVYFIIGLAGIMGVWSGLMNIARETGLIDLVARATKPLFRFLFPLGLAKDTIAMILMSFTANLFGAGNSATVFSIKAMVMLDEENHHRETASNAMCMFLVINASSIQILPLTLIAIRGAYGSANPADIVLPSLIATGISTLAAIFLARIMERRY